MSKREKRFVLVHGGGHGAWCWYKVATLLKSAGHEVTALDLAASGIHPKQVHDIASNISHYYEPLMEFMALLPPEEKVMLVGHSLGGISVSVAMEKFPDKISVAVFVTALMLSEHFPYSAPDEACRRVDSFMDTQFTFEDGPDKPPTMMLLGANFLASNFYQLSPPEDLSLALSLVRPVRLYNDVEMLRKETAVTKERNGRVPKIFIVCDQDKMIKEDLQRWIIEKSAPNEVKVIAGSDHMVMFSKPVELFSCLQQIAHKY